MISVFLNCSADISINPPREKINQLFIFLLNYKQALLNGRFKYAELSAPFVPEIIPLVPNILTRFFISVIV